MEQRNGPDCGQPAIVNTPVGLDLTGPQLNKDAEAMVRQALVGGRDEQPDGESVFRTAGQTVACGRSSNGS